MVKNISINSPSYPNSFHSNRIFDHGPALPAASAGAQAANLTKAAVHAAHDVGHGLGIKIA